MTLDLELIKKRLDRAGPMMSQRTEEDMNALIAEVDRLQAENASLWRVYHAVEAVKLSITDEETPA